MLPFQSLDAATEAGPGGALDAQESLASWSMVAPVSGTFEDLVVIALEVSHDGSSWVQLDSQNVPSGEVGTANATAFPARYVRANCTTCPTGAVVSATVAGS